MIPEWVIKNLLEYGNCYVLEDKYDLDKISQEVGFKVIKRFAKVTGTGWVLEKEKD